VSSAEKKNNTEN